jgi:hypothetical protein
MIVVDFYFKPCGCCAAAAAAEDYRRNSCCIRNLERIKGWDFFNAPYRLTPSLLHRALLPLITTISKTGFRFSPNFHQVVAVGGPRNIYKTLALGRKHNNCFSDSSVYTPNTL